MIDRRKIIARREQLGLTMDEAAARAGFTGRQRWNQIEKGERSDLTVKTLAAVAKALDCRVVIDDLVVKLEPKRR